MSNSIKHSTHDERPALLMLLTNAYDPDPRVRQEALALLGAGCRVKLLASDRDDRDPRSVREAGVPHVLDAPLVDAPSSASRRASANSLAVAYSRSGRTCATAAWGRCDVCAPSWRTSWLPALRTG